jgi:hypothetical protein
LQGSKRFKLGSTEQRSPKSVVARAIVATKAAREAAEEELESLPRWSMLRRAELERRIARARGREESLLAQLGGVRQAG